MLEINGSNNLFLLYLRAISFKFFVDSVGAVALPDGRVLICGGEILERINDEVNKLQNFCILQIYFIKFNYHLNKRK